MSPSAFIPFCSFGEDLKQVGTKSEHFEVPVCKIFKPVILKDQLCYKADIEKFRNLEDINKLKKQFEIGLILLLDHNEEKQLNIDNKEKEILKDDETRIFNQNYGNPTFIHLNTISRLNIYQRNVELKDFCYYSSFHLQIQ